MPSFLVIAPQGLGDALEATPIVGALRAAEPDARIDVAVLRPGPRQLFSELTGYVDAVLYYPYWERGGLAFIGAVARSLLTLRRYDASLLAYPAARKEYELLAGLHRARRRVAHDYWPSKRVGRKRPSEVLVEVRPAHNVIRNLDLVRAIGIEPDSGVTYLVPPSWVSGQPVDNRIALHVGTVTHHGLERKRWPVERFVELARRLADDGYEVCVISGPDERADSRAIVQAVPSARLFEGPLDSVARFLSGCAAAVTNDSGIGHLAAAVGTRVLALHGPTPVEGGPYGPRAVRFRPSPCPACFDPRLRNTSCALDIDYACLRLDMTVERVQSALHSLLAAPA